MSFRLYPLPESKLDNIRPLFDEAHSEMEAPKLANVDQVMRSVHAGYEGRTLALYVDDINSPKHGVMLTTVPSILMEGLSVIVLWIYSTPEERGNKEKLDVMHTLIDTFAQVNMAGSVIGSSWVYGGSRGIDKMWEAYGYQRQENTYIKEF